MLTIRNEGPFLVQELDVSLDQDNAIVIDQSDLEILIPEDELVKTKKLKVKRQKKKEQNQLQSEKNKSENRQVTQKKEKKQQKLHSILCKNKFFKDIDFNSPQIIQKNEFSNSPLKFGKKEQQVSNESQSFKSMMESVQKYKEQISWSNKKDNIQIPKKLFKEEIQEIEVFIPQIKGINDSICSNTLYFNKIKDKILHVSSPQKCSLDIKLPQGKSRDTYLQYLKDIQMNRMISQNKVTP